MQRAQLEQAGASAGEWSEDEDVARPWGAVSGDEMLRRCNVEDGDLEMAQQLVATPNDSGAAEWGSTFDRCLEQVRALDFLSAVATCRPLRLRSGPRLGRSSSGSTG